MSSSRLDFSQGPLSHATVGLTRHMLLAMCLIVASSPALIATVLLGNTLGNVGWLVLAQIPLAPAFSGGLYVVRNWRASDTLSVWRPFWRGFRMNLGDVLKWWVPALILGAAAGVNLTVSPESGASAFLRPLAAAVLVVLFVWSCHALVISSFFSFRTRDVARIAAAEMILRWRVSLSYLSLAVVCLGVIYVGTEALLLLVSWAFVSLAEVISRPVVDHVTVTFTQAPGESEED